MKVNKGYGDLIVHVLGADNELFEATLEQICAHFDLELVFRLIFLLFLFRVRAEEREGQQVVAFSQQSTEHWGLAT